MDNESIIEKVSKLNYRMENDEDGTLAAPKGEYTDRLTGEDCAIYDQDLSLFVVLAMICPNPDQLQTALSN